MYISKIIIKNIGTLRLTWQWTASWGVHGSTTCCWKTYIKKIKFSNYKKFVTFCIKWLSNVYSPTHSSVYQYWLVNDQGLIAWIIILLCFSILACKLWSLKHIIDKWITFSDVMKSLAGLSGYNYDNCWIGRFRFIVIVSNLGSLQKVVVWLMAVQNVI